MAIFNYNYDVHRIGQEAITYMRDKSLFFRNQQSIYLKNPGHCLKRILGDRYFIDEAPALPEGACVTPTLSEYLGKSRLHINSLPNLRYECDTVSGAACFTVNKLYGVSINIYKVVDYIDRCELFGALTQHAIHRLYEVTLPEAWDHYDNIPTILSYFGKHNLGTKRAQELLAKLRRFRKEHGKKAKNVYEDVIFTTLNIHAAKLANIKPKITNYINNAKMFRQASNTSQPNSPAFIVENNPRSALTMARYMHFPYEPERDQNFWDRCNPTLIDQVIIRDNRHIQNLRSLSLPGIVQTIYTPIVMDGVTSLSNIATSIELASDTPRGLAGILGPISSKVPYEIDWDKILNNKNGFCVLDSYNFNPVKGILDKPNLGLPFGRQHRSAYLSKALSSPVETIGLLRSKNDDCLDANGMRNLHICNDTIGDNFADYLFARPNAILPFSLAHYQSTYSRQNVICAEKYHKKHNANTKPINIGPTCIFNDVEIPLTLCRDAETFAPKMLLSRSKDFDFNDITDTNSIDNCLVTVSNKMLVIALVLEGYVQHRKETVPTDTRLLEIFERLALKARKLSKEAATIYKDMCAQLDTYIEDE